MILGREEERYTPLRPGMALLGCANAFTDMVKWHIKRYPENLRSQLLAAAVDGASELSRTLRAGALQLTLECDVSRLLPEIFK